MSKPLITILLLSGLSFFPGCGQDDNYNENEKDNEISPPDSSLLFKNPVFEPDLADPTIIRGEDGWFYAYGTENTWYNSVHHVVPIIKSKDLVNWYLVGDAFLHKPSWKEGGIWAPEITRIGNIYYLYYAFSTWGDQNAAIGFATSPSPSGPFTDQGKLFNSDEIGVFNSIDPSIFRYENKVYLIWGSLGGGIYGIELSADGRKILGTKFQIAGNSFEAAYIYQKDSRFYLFLSTASCCEGASSVYRVVAGRSENFKGPYFTESGKSLLLYNNSWYPPFVDKIEGVVLQGNLKIAGPGHNGQIINDDNGTDWFIYHAIQRSNPLLPDGATRRPLFIDKIEWANGWPIINKGKGPSYEYVEKPIFSE